MPLANTRELKEDVLFRASEPLTLSDWDGKVIDYLNRVYRTLCAGTSEFLPEYVEDWWWMRATANLVLQPIFQTGTLNVTNNDIQIIFSSPPTEDLTGWRLRLQGEPDVYLIATHSAMAAPAILDMPFLGQTNTAITFQAMKVTYDLASSVQALISPISAFQRPERINGVSPERLDELLPLIDLQPGFPELFALENDRQVRFSHGGRNDGIPMRVEYRYRPSVVDLTDSAMSIPLVPAQFMHLLSDMALVYVLIDKNDDRSNATALAARTGLGAMLKDNRRRNVKVDASAGHISPRGRGLGGTNYSPARRIRTTI